MAEGTSHAPTGLLPRGPQAARHPLGRVAAAGALLGSGWADYRALFSLRTWTLGWLIRVTAQVTYFGLLGVLVSNPAATERLVLGNAVVLTAVSTLFAVSAIARERHDRTIEMLRLAPYPLTAALALRNAVWVADGCVTGMLALVMAGAALHLHLSVGIVLLAFPACLASGVATLGLALVLGRVVLDYPSARTLSAGLVTVALTSLTGINFPLDSLSWIAHALPCSDSARALRDYAEGKGGLGALLAAAVTAFGWMVLAVLVIRNWESTVRRKG